MLRFSALSSACLATFCALPPAQAQAPSGRPPGIGLTLTVEAATTSQTDLTGRDRPAGGISVAQGGFKLSAPLPPLRDGWYPVVGLSYRHYELNRAANTPLPDQLKSLGAAFTLIALLPPDWTFIGSLSPRVANSGQGFSQHGLGYGALALASRKFNPNFSAGFGLIYDSLARGTGRMMPVATFEWKPAPAWRYSLGFPRTGVFWQWRQNLKFELSAEADFGSFYVADDPLTRATIPAALAPPALNRTRLEYRSIRFGPGATWTLSPSLETRWAAGAVPLLNAEYRKRNYKLNSTGTTAFASLELVWKF
jgi:Domain of unknown function (DUF6268)